LIAELRAGVIERSRVTPVSRLALLLGRSLRDVVSLIAQAVIITLLALLFDLRVFIGYLLLAYLMLALISLMTSAVSYGVALMVKSEDALAPLMNTVAQPVLLLSGILLPLTFAPGWLQGIADWNPFSWAVNGTRALFRGDLGASDVWQGLVIMAVLAALAVVWAAREFARSVR
jgi:ABC-2 type transport system permease protein